MRYPFPDPVPAAEGLADTPGARLWYQDTGGGGEVLVLCHPVSQSSLVWVYQLPAFARAGLRVIAWSRRGHYRSERGSEDAPGTAAGDLAALLDALGVDRAHVLGAAAGGITATAFAVAHPHRVRSLVLAGTIVAPDEEEWRELYARLGMVEASRLMPRAFLELGPSYRALEPEGTARFAELEALGTAHGARPLRQPPGAAVTWAALEALTRPVLLLTGEADLYAPPPLHEMIARHLPVHERITLREVGHSAYWEQPDEFNRLVLDFVRRHADG